MRSKLGTQSRLAAHILALVLLILMLVYLSPGPSVKALSLPSRPVAEPAADIFAAAPLAGHALPGHTDTLDRIHSGVPSEPDSPATLRPPAAEPAPETADAPPLTGLRPTDGAEQPAEESAPAIPEEKPETPAAASPGDSVPPSSPQPDESGSLVVAPADSGLTQRVAATTPLPNANLEVLGDGVYWLDPSHDLETELTAIPEIGTLVLLTPLPGYRVNGFEHVKTEAIAADAADLDHDSVEHFLHVAADAKRPIVIAPLSGARGGAFFKGVYLLANRNLSTEEVLREIAPELDQSGEARHEIIHRLLSLARTMRP